LVRSIREAELTLGTGRKEPCLIEIKNAKGMRRSIVAARKIRAGEVFSSSMLTCKRPGTGIKPALLPELIGCVVSRDIAEDELITWAMCGERK
jgi:sialic acid synthase SpsE